MFNKSIWIEIDCIGEISKTKYFGRFEVKPYLKHSEKSDAVRLAEVYCRGIRDNIGERTFLTSLAFVKMHIISTDAPWWRDDGMDLVDENPIYEIIKKVNEIQAPPAPASQANEPEPT